MPPARTLAVGFALILSACGPAAVPSNGTAEKQAANAPPSHLTLAIATDANGLATKLDTVGGSFATEFKYMSNSPLALLDPKGTPRAHLAADLPSQERGSWTVNPDGTMVTTWRIRPNAFWHDSARLTSSDFVFALQVYLDPDVPVPTRLPEQFMDRVEPSGPQAFSIYWKQTYPGANLLALGQLEPLPEHLLKDLYGSDKSAFVNASFWSSSTYVGNGPYVLQDWEKGIQLVYRAFDQYFLGRPLIDQVTIRIIGDPNTVVANVLSGTVDATLGVTLPHIGGQIVKERWETSGEGQLLQYPTTTRFSHFQHDPARSKQPALGDVRVRQAIIHGLDRQSIAEVISPGAARVAEQLISPSNPLYELVQQAAPPYRFDRSRALALLQEAGWTKRGDMLISSSGQPFTLDIRTPEQTNNETQMGLMAADLTVLGMQVSQTLRPLAQGSDREATATFPGLYVLAGTLDAEGMRLFTGAECPNAQLRFVGSNVGCWINSDYDRLFQVISTSLNEQERNDAMVAALKVLSEEAGAFGTSYVIENVSVRKGLLGPAPRWPTQKGNTWNIYEWRWS